KFGELPCKGRNDWLRNPSAPDGGGFHTSEPGAVGGAESILSSEPAVAWGSGSRSPGGDDLSARAAAPLLHRERAFEDKSRGSAAGGELAVGIEDVSIGAGS